MDCLFCESGKDKLVENAHAYAMYDGYPVNEGHALILTKRHVASFFELSAEEVGSLYGCLEEAKRVIDRRYNPDGYNVGVNVGKAAGQTIYHVHIHLIPRYHGDIPAPRGGVRGVIPHKRGY